MVTDDNTNKLWSRLRQLEDEIEKLRGERDEQAALVAQLREQVADYDALIERLTTGFAKLKADHELRQRGGDEVKNTRRERKTRAKPPVA